MIPQDKVVEYWKERAARQGPLTVGFAGNDEERQEHEYALKKGFVGQFLDTSLYTLDFGCGTGRYSRMFLPGLYLGADICSELLQIARARNPQYHYWNLTVPNLEPGLVTRMREAAEVQQFFTATVLQHNSNDGVITIFKQLAALPVPPKVIFMYENTSNLKSGGHMAFRDPLWYIEMVRKHIGPCLASCHSNVVHGERHSAIQCKMTGAH